MYDLESFFERFQLRWNQKWHVSSSPFVQRFAFNFRNSHIRNELNNVKARMCAIRYAYKVRLRSLKIQKKKTPTQQTLQNLCQRNVSWYSKKNEMHAFWKITSKRTCGFLKWKTHAVIAFFHLNSVWKKSKLGYATRMYEWLLYVYLFVEKNYKIC